MIPYGAELGPVETRRRLDRLGLEPRSIFSTSAAWSRRTTRCWCGSASSRSDADEARADRRRALRGRVHPARCATRTIRAS